MAELTPEEIADFKAMAEDPHVMYVSGEAFLELERQLDRDPQVLPRLEQLMKQQQTAWAESPVISTTEAP